MRGALFTTTHRFGLAPALGIVAALALAACSAAKAPDSGPNDTARAPPETAGRVATDAKTSVLAHRFIVAAAHPLATDAGHQILAAGGSAVDAAIAVQMVLTLVEPQSSGIGGGLFLVHHDGKQVQTIDGRETAPSGATPDMFMRDGQPMPFSDAVVGGRSVGVPGALRALTLAHKMHGKLPWDSLFEPAIRLAEQGFPIGERLAAQLREESARSLRLDANAAYYFFEPDGQPKRAGNVLRNPDLAELLRAIAERGDAAFYEGAVAQEIATKVWLHTRNPGTLTVADLTRYRAVVREPLCFDYKAWRLCGMPPPSSGPLAIGQMLGMFEHGALSLPAPAATKAGFELDAWAVHVFSEAGRLAYADRARFVADPDFVALPGGAAALLAPRYLRERADLIGVRSMGRANPGAPVAGQTAWADDVSAERPSTSHVSIADEHGNTLAMTSSIENAFGAQMMVRGFLLNNQLTDFSFQPSVDGAPVANRVEAGKRPRSSMAPILVFERSSGRIVASLGSPGGTSIINYTAKMLLAMLDWRLDAQQAVTVPNFGSRNGPTELELGRAPPELVAALRLRGHEVRVLPQTSGVQAIQRVVRDGRPVWLGGADPRREGTVRGE